MGGIRFGRYGEDFRHEVLVPVLEMVTLEAFFECDVRSGL